MQSHRPATAPAERLASLKIVVDPAWRRRGLGVALLKELLALDDDPEAEIHTLVRPDRTAGLAFLAVFGFAAVEEEIAMKLLAPPATARPMDANILFEQIEDVAPVADAIARIHNAAYANDAAFRAHDGDEMERALRDAELWVARECNNIVGFCVAEPEAAGVWIESLAIDPSRQGRGVGAALLRRVLVARQMGFGRSASLQVSSLQSAARRAYVRLGFVETGRRIRFSARRREINACLQAACAGPR